MTPSYVLDNKVVRETYADLYKRGYARGISYWQYLTRLNERNVAQRRAEFNERRLYVDNLKEFLDGKSNRN